MSMTILLRSKLYEKKWPLVLAVIFLLFALNLIPAVHETILAADRSVARAANGLLGRSPAFDLALGSLSTHLGDALVLAGMGLLFLAHSLRGANRQELIRRLAFWGWVGFLCVAAYALQSQSEHFIKRAAPFRAMPELLNLETEHGLKLRTHGTSAFPSGHAFAYIFFALMAWRGGYPWMALLLGGLAVLMPGVRLVVGVHWLSDIVLGAFPQALLLAALAWHTSLLKTLGLLQRAMARVIGRIEERLTPHREPAGKLRAEDRNPNKDRLESGQRTGENTA